MPNLFKQLRNQYVINQVNTLSLPDFAPSPLVRYHLVFCGRVQHVGFRLEVQQLALRLGCFGWAKNLDNGAVEAEIQGEENKITFLLDFMHSLVRIKIKRLEKVQMDLISQGEEFLIL